MPSKYYSTLYRYENQLKHLVTAEVKPPISDLANSRINRLRRSLYYPDHGFKECYIDVIGGIIATKLPFLDISPKVSKH